MDTIISCFNLKSPDSSVRITKRCDGVDLVVSLQDLIPRWTTTGRPANPVEPNMGYNTLLHIFEYWNGSSWLPFGSGTDAGTAALILALTGDNLLLDLAGDNLILA